MTLWEMLVWTYRDQKAHRLLDTPMAWWEWSVAEIDSDMVGISTPRVDIDAAILHAVVTELPTKQAYIIVHHAALAEKPEPCTAQPMPHPVTRISAVGVRRDDKWGRNVVDGRRVEHLVRLAEDAVEIVPVLERRGRRMVVVGTRVEKTPVEYCPLDWQPDRSYVEMVNATYAAWTEAMAELERRVRGVRFRHLTHQQAFVPTISDRARDSISASEPT